MKNFILLLITSILFGSCNQKQPADVAVETKPDSTSSSKFPEKIADGTIYEVNIRQHTAEGTINAFAKDLQG